MAYPAYGSNGTYTNSATASIALPYPATVNSGDLLIAYFGKDYTTNNSLASVATGWSRLTGAIGNTSPKTGSERWVTYLCYRRADGTETGNATFTFNAAPLSQCRGLQFRFTAVTSGGFPFERLNSYKVVSSTSAGTTYTAPGGTTTDTERLLATFTAVWNNTSVNTATSWTGNYLSTGQSVTFKVQTRQVATAQTVGDGTAGLGVSSVWTSTTVPLLPDLGGWKHNFLGVDNFNIHAISGEEVATIEAVNTVT